MKNSKIEWCDSTWSPVTGCYHNCEYCYARRIANRFGAHIKNYNYEFVHDVAEKWETTTYQDDCVTVESKRTCPYPFDFEPTFHRYRLNEPQTWKKPKTIFVCSMADLFGEWVPDEWIQEVFSACEKAKQHRYLFLTKNPARYLKLAKAEMLPFDENFWYGSTATGPDVEAFFSEVHNTFVSIEPLLKPFKNAGVYGIHKYTSWAIIGAETGNRAGKVVPEREWIEDIVGAFHGEGKPVFMKDSLIPIMGEGNMRREFPWGRMEESTVRGRKVEKRVITK